MTVSDNLHGSPPKISFRNDYSEGAHPRLLQALSAAHVGVEVMDTRAACRTFNILVAEDRRVAAALIVA